MPIDELAALAERLRAAGETVVLAHGVFDVLHLGHVRHLTEARSYGTRLLVTVTCDQHVNKGPGRPYFPDLIRAEMLANLSCVDYVGINYAASAVDAIESIRPQVYAKGSDYIEASDDITNRITLERHAVELHGGRIQFTDDITFSSSSIINQNFSVHDADLHEYLTGLRGDNTLPRLLALLERIAELRVLFIGDTIIDEYQYVNPLGKAQKENIITTHHQSSEFFAGGVIATANHLANFCPRIEVLTMLGEDDQFTELAHQTLHPTIKPTFLRCIDRPTTRKQRFIDKGYLRKLFEIYYMDDQPLDPVLEAQLNETLVQRLGEFDLVVANDFGHGFIASSTIDQLTEKSRFLAVNTQTNSGNFGFNLITKYPTAGFVCIDAPEARLAVSDKFSDLKTIVGESLPKRIECDNFIVTYGRAGCFALTNGGELHHIPAFTTNVIDTVGAGDAFFSLASPLVALGADINDAAFIGNVAGALQVGVVGHRRSVEKTALVKYLTALLK